MSYPSYECTNVDITEQLLPSTRFQYILFNILKFISDKGKIIQCRKIQAPGETLYNEQNEGNKET